MCRVVVSFNRGHLNKQAMQAHRAFRFIGEKLFSTACIADKHDDGWGVVKLNHDVGVMMDEETTVRVAPGKKKRKTKKEIRKVWRIGNVVDIRMLKSDPGTKKSSQQLQDCEVQSHDIGQIDINEPRAVIKVRWYHECDRNGNVLTGCQNKECKALYHLPVMGEDHAEPCVWVSNHAVIESIRMCKEDGYVKTCMHGERIEIT